MTNTSSKNEKTKSKPNIYIQAIYVKDLFGRYTYNISNHNNSQFYNPNYQLLLLYGDNGCGKTTILRTIYNLLGTELNQGLRGEIGRTPFLEFRIDFSNGLSLSADRYENESIVGNYKITISRNEKQIFKVHIALDEESRANTNLNPAISDLVEALEQLNLGVIFLPDDRKIRGLFDLSETHRSEPDFDEAILKERRRLLRWRKATIREREPSPFRDDEFDFDARSASRRLTNWINQRVVEASTTGDTSANQIHLELLDRISKHGDNAGTEDNEERRDELLSQIEQLSKRTAYFAEFGFISNFPAREIQHSINKAESSSIRFIDLVMRPYIDSISARLEALADVEQKTRIFLETLSSFYVDKNVYYHFKEGLYVRSNDGDPIDVGSLSSGERQLLTILANAILATEKPNVFIIDEPEISLNIKWQRVILENLMKLVENSDVQFILATHSIELLSPHMDKVAHLKAE